MFKATKSTAKCSEEYNSIHGSFLSNIFKQEIKGRFVIRKCLHHALQFHAFIGLQRLNLKNLHCKGLNRLALMDKEE